MRIFELISWVFAREIKGARLILHDGNGLVARTKPELVDELAVEVL